MNHKIRWIVVVAPEVKAEGERQVAETERALSEQAAWPAEQGVWEQQNNVADTENAGFKNGWAAPEFDDQSWLTVNSHFNFQTVTQTNAGGNNFGAAISCQVHSFVRLLVVPYPSTVTECLETNSLPLYYRAGLSGD